MKAVPAAADAADAPAATAVRTADAIAAAAETKAAAADFDIAQTAVKLAFRVHDIKNRNSGRNHGNP